MAMNVRGAVAASVATILLVPAGSAVGATTGTILVFNSTTNRLVGLDPTTGGARSTYACWADATHTGLRRFVIGSGTSIHIATDAELAGASSCPTGDLVFEDTSMTIVGPKWSRDGSRISFGGKRPNADPNQSPEIGIWVGDVITDASGDASLANVHLAVPLGTEQVLVSWSSDNHRVAYAYTVEGATQPDIFVANLDTGIVQNVTTSTTAEFQPDFSPDGNRLAFIKPSDKGGVQRNDVFVTNLTNGSLTQVTSKSNVNALQISSPSWSPDGSAIAFQGYPSGFGDPAPDVWRVSANGRGKATNLTAASTNRFGAPMWRP